MDSIPFHSLHIPVRDPFDFSATLAYLTRSRDECLFLVEDGILWRAAAFTEGRAVVRVQRVADGVVLHWWGDSAWEGGLRRYLADWLGLDDDMAQFFDRLGSHPIIGPVVRQHAGLRLVGVPDLFEALAWAVIGQQIHLALAYAIKKRLTVNLGDEVQGASRMLWLFPTAERISKTSLTDLVDLGLSRRKAEYLVGIAQLMASGQLDRDSLGTLSKDAAMARLTAIRGVGPWTAQYVLMRCLRYNDIYPVADVGLHNALRLVMHREDKPTIKEVEALFQEFQGYEAYATFYLWHHLATQGRTTD